MTASEITAYATGVAGILAAIASAYALWKKTRTDSEEREEEVDTKKARENLKRKKDETNYIISKWQELYENLNKKVEELLAKESSCQKRLVRAETLLAQFSERLNIPYPELKETDSGEIPAVQ